MSEYYHIVPWFNSKEWNKVYTIIYSETLNKQEALNLLWMWKARCPSLPSGIESTLGLLEVYVQDMKQSDDIANDQLLRLAYSSAIMRFVNHMLDTETSKGSSLYQAAKNLGVPDWIVDLRHDTAHSNILPSITLLRNASLISLEWLKNNYWDKYNQCIQDYTSGQKVIFSTSDDNKIAALINFCISLGVCSHSKIKHIAQIPNDSMRESILNDASELFCDHIDCSKFKTITIEKLINLMNLNSQKLLKSKNPIAHVINALLGEDSLFLSLELFDFLSDREFKTKNELSRSYVQCFEVLLTFLHTNDLLLELVLALIKITQSNDSCEKKLSLAALWICEILAALQNSNTFIKRAHKMNSENVVSKTKKELKVLYHHWFPNEKSRGLVLDLQKPVPSELTNIHFVNPIISSYNPYLIYFVRQLLNLIEPRLPKLVSEKICKLAKLISAPERFPAEFSSRIYTVDDLKSAQDKNSLSDVSNSEMDDYSKTSNKFRRDELVSCIWSLASGEHNWSSCPIGMLPWQQERADDVEMES